jgi:hypothetical protein
VIQTYDTKVVSRAIHLREICVKNIVRLGDAIFAIYLFLVCALQYSVGVLE